MNDHTYRILSTMLAVLDDYQAKRLSLRYLVDSLESSLNVLEERLPESFYAEWYSHWGGLEEVLAAGTEAIRATEIEKDISKLKAIVRDQVQSQTSAAEN